MCGSATDGKTTLGIICIFWLQARRARSDAPYRAGRAKQPFDRTVHLGYRDLPLRNRHGFPAGLFFAMPLGILRA